MMIIHVTGGTDKGDGDAYTHISLKWSFPMYHFYQAPPDKSDDGTVRGQASLEMTQKHTHGGPSLDVVISPLGQDWCWEAVQVPGHQSERHGLRGPRDCGVTSPVGKISSFPIVCVRRKLRCL